MEENDGWSLFLQVKLKNTQVKHAPSKIPWRELSNGISYVAKPSDRQKVILNLPITAECSDKEENDGWSLFMQVKLENTQVNYTPSEISWKELSSGV